MTSAVWRFGILASSPKFGDFAKNPNHDFALVTDHGRDRLVDVVLGQLSVFLNSFGMSVRDLLNFGRGPSQNPQKLTLAALKPILDQTLLGSTVEVPDQTLSWLC